MKKYTLTNEMAKDIIKVHGGIAVTLAKKFHNASFTFDEVLVVAREALLSAYNNYNPEIGAFSTYAYKYVSGSLQSLRREHYKHIFSKNTVDITHVDPYNIDSVNKEKTIEDMLTKLNEREVKILLDTYYEDKTNMMIAEDLGITHQRVAQLHNDIITKLKKRYNSSYVETVKFNRRRVDKRAS